MELAYSCSEQSALPLTTDAAPPGTVSVPGTHATHSALSECADSVASGTVLRMSHSLTVWSCEAVATWCEEEGLQRTQLIQLL